MPFRPIADLSTLLVSHEPPNTQPQDVHHTRCVVEKVHQSPQKRQIPTQYCRLHSQYLDSSIVQPFTFWNANVKKHSAVFRTQQPRRNPRSTFAPYIPLHCTPRPTSHQKLCICRPSSDTKSISSGDAETWRPGQASLGPSEKRSQCSSCEALMHKTSSQCTELAMLTQQRCRQMEAASQKVLQ